MPRPQEAAERLHAGHVLHHAADGLAEQNLRPPVPFRASEAQHPGRERPQALPPRRPRPVPGFRLAEKDEIGGESLGAQMNRPAIPLATPKAGIVSVRRGGSLRKVSKWFVAILKV